MKELEKKKHIAILKQNRFSAKNLKKNVKRHRKVSFYGLFLTNKMRSIITIRS